MPATPYANLPLYHDRERPYQHDEVMPRVRKWASTDGSGDPDKIDFKKFRKAFLWYDDKNPDQIGSYKLKIADVIDGELYAVWRGVTVAAAVMQGSRGGTTIPNQDRGDVKRQIEKYYAKARKKFNDDTIKVPWDQSAAGEASWDFKINAQGDGQRIEIFIYGDIGDTWDEESTTAARFVEELHNLGGAPVTVRVNSYGGCVSDGLAIYNAMRRYPGGVDVVIDGVAVSAASLIAMAGDRVSMAENALMMIHAPWGMSVGNSVDMRAAAQMLDTFAEAMSMAYASKTGKAKADVMPWLTDGQDHWFVAEDALTQGLVDEVLPARQAAARFDAEMVARFPLPVAVAASLTHKEIKPMTTKKGATPAEPQGSGQPVAEPQAGGGDNVASIEAAAQKRLREQIKARNENLAVAFEPFLDRTGVRAVYDACLRDPNISEDQARAKLLDELGKRGSPVAGPARAGEDERDLRVNGMTAAILARVGAEEHDGANPFRGRSMIETARACLESAGVATRDMSNYEVAEKVVARYFVRSDGGGQSTSDFPVILENVLHKLVLLGFQAQPVTWSMFCRTGDVSDFRAWKRLVPGLLGDLDTVNERGEYLNKNLPDAEANSISATRRGNIINITPEVLINDDTGYIQTMANGLGMMGNRAIERAVYTVLNNNPTLSDGVALFHGNHNNLAGSGAAPSVTSIDEGRVGMRAQTAPGDDQEFLEIQPYVAVCHDSVYGDMVTINNAQYDPDTANKLQKPNKVRGMFQEVAGSPRIAKATTYPWYMFANPAVSPVMEVVFLNGQRTPRVVQQEEWRTSGLAWKIELPFGAGAIDYRGGWKNPGA